MDFKEALMFRHACKVFDESKSISDADFKDILESARLAPSSFGLEQWEFEVIRDVNLKQKIRTACWDQVQITSASELIVIYAKIADLKPESAYIKEQFSRKTHHDENAVAAYIERFKGFFARFGDDKEIYGWSKAQCFLACQNMMMQAALLGIDSCAIEGFEEAALNEVLGIDPAKKRVAMLLPLGYRIKEAQPKIRRNLDEIVSYR